MMPRPLETTAEYRRNLATLRLALGRQLERERSAWRRIRAGGLFHWHGALWFVASGYFITWILAHTYQSLAGEAMVLANRGLFVWGLLHLLLHELPLGIIAVFIYFGRRARHSKE